MNKLSKSIIEYRKSLVDLEKELKHQAKANNELVIGDSNKFPLNHTFAHGIYVREMKMQKDTFVLGKIHQHDHIWFLLTGKLLIETGEGVEEYIAPCYVKASGGTQRLIRAVEDSIFVNVYGNPNNKENVSELENNIIAKNYLEYEKIKQLKL
tara:strand:+ start:100 stop:558 length:459 start_codon:yes stop_codon:yes gene_type:complete